MTLVLQFLAALAVFALALLYRQCARRRRAARAPPDAGWLVAPFRRACRGLSAGALGARGVALIDLNNVRGRLGFQRADETAFCAALARWAVDERLAGRLVAAVDHGPQRWAAEVGGLVVQFAGQAETADDAIVASVGWLAGRGSAPIVVVTSDRLLRQRCRAAFRAAAVAARAPRNVDEAAAVKRGANGSLKLVDSAELADALAAGALAAARANPAPGWGACVPAPAQRAPGRRGQRSCTALEREAESTEEREAHARALHARLRARAPAGEHAGTRGGARDGGAAEAAASDLAWALGGRGLLSRGAQGRHQLAAEHARDRKGASSAASALHLCAQLGDAYVAWVNGT